MAVGQSLSWVFFFKLSSGTLITMSVTEKWLSWILKGGLLLTPFLVFIVTRSLYFPFITGKNFAFRILIEILAALWVYAALRFPRFRPQISPVFWAVTAFLLVMGIATISALSPYRSFWSNFERMEGYLGLLHLFAYFILLISVFKEERDWKAFFYTSLGASVIISIYAVFQLAGKLDIHQGGTRVDATLGNATYLAAYILFHLFFLAFFFLRTKNLWLRVGLGTVFLFELVILYHTATRGAMLGLLGGIFLLALLLSIFARGNTRRIAFGCLGIAIAIPILFLLVRNASFVKNSEVLNRFASISPSETTTVGRLTIWKMAIEGWQERPVLGWGQDAFIYVFSKNYDPALWRQEPWFDRAHNVFLDWLIAGGVLGLASYLSMFAAALWMLIRAFRRSSIDIISFGVLGSLLAAHFFQILFVFDNLTSYLLFFAVLAYVHVVARSARSPRPRLLPAGIPAAGGVAAALAVVLLLYFANVKPIMTAGDILDALVTAGTAEPAGRIDTLIAKFKEGIALNTFGTTETREQVSQLASLVARDASLADQDKMKYLEFAISELEAQRKSFPSDVRAIAFLATLYSTAGRPEDAIRMTEDALAISPQRQQFYFIEAEAYINLGQGEKAIEVLKKAYDLAPDYPEALVNLGTVLILVGKGDQAEVLLQEKYGMRFIGDPHYAQAYTQIGEFGKAAEVWKLIVAGSPASAESHANYGGVLARAGRRDEAIREFEEAIRLEPRFETQGRQIIEQIRNGEIQ